MVSYPNRNMVQVCLGNDMRKYHSIIKMISNNVMALTFRSTNFWVTNARVLVASEEEKGNSFLFGGINSFVDHPFYNI